MSWDSYRDNLVASGCVDKAAICGLDDGSVWTQSPGLNVQPAEVKALMAGFKKADTLASSGFKIGNVKYFYLTSDDSQIQGKQGSNGVSIAKSKKCIIIGTYKDGQAAGNCRKQVEKMCEYLVSSGY